MASKASFYKIIDVEHFVVNPCFNSCNRRVITNFEVNQSSQ